VAKNLATLDETHQYLQGVADEEKKYQRNKADTTLKERINQGYQLAQKAGPEVLAQFNQDVTADPERAIQSVADLTARSEQENTIADLTTLGLDPKQFYGPSGQFLAGHAKSAINLETKKQAGATAEVKRQIDIMNAMSQVREKAKKRDDDATAGLTEEQKKDYTPEWGEDREAAYNQVISQAGASLLPRQQPGQPLPQQVQRPGVTVVPSTATAPKQPSATKQAPAKPLPAGVVEKTATGPNGAKMARIGGKWYAM
jgi:hypothetical protein